MNEPEPHFLPPNPDMRVSEITPTRLQERAIAVGKMMMEGDGTFDVLPRERVLGRYRDLKIAMAQNICETGFISLPSTEPLGFEIVAPVENSEEGLEVVRKTWHFLPEQYLGSISKGIYPISLHGGKPINHDASHAAEIAIIQKYTPGVSQLMIDVATIALESNTETQEAATLLIDYFTDTFNLDELSMGIFEWRVSDLLKIAHPELSPEEIQRKAKALSLETLSGLDLYVAESFEIDLDK